MRLSVFVLLLLLLLLLLWWFCCCCCSSSSTSCWHYFRGSVQAIENRFVGSSSRCCCCSIMNAAAAAFVDGSVITITINYYYCTTETRHHSTIFLIWLCGSVGFSSLRRTNYLLFPLHNYFFTLPPHSLSFGAQLPFLFPFAGRQGRECCACCVVNMSVDGWIGVVGTSLGIIIAHGILTACGGAGIGISCCDNNNYMIPYRRTSINNEDKKKIMGIWSLFWRLTHYAFWRIFRMLRVQDGTVTAYYYTTRFYPSSAVGKNEWMNEWMNI